MAIDCWVVATVAPCWCRDGSLWLAEPWDGLVLVVFGSQGRVWLSQGFPELPFPASLTTSMGCDNLWMTNGAMVLNTP